jgi:hypothetical protein
MTRTADTTLTQAERRRLAPLRRRYRQDCDCFSDRERAHLLFLRWLYRNGLEGGHRMMRDA